MPGAYRGHAGAGCRLAAMTFVERALTFDCCGERLVGVLAEPAAFSKLGLVLVVGGPQYRVGSHRQFVLNAYRRCRKSYLLIDGYDRVAQGLRHKVVGG